MNRKVRLFVVCGILLSVVLLAVPALAAPKVVNAPKVGPPTTKVTVIGTGFNAYEAVDVYFDSTDLFLAATDDTGKFTASIKAPASAAPGVHWITAIGRNSHLAAQKSFRVRTDWAQYRNGPRHTGYNPHENVLSRATVGGLGLAWAMPIGGEIYSSPAVADGKVFVGAEDGYLYSFNADTGGSGHVFGTSGEIRSSPAVANGVVYVGSANNNLYAFNASTGAPKAGFPVTTGGIIYSSPAVANGVVYVGSDDGKLYAFNALNGNPLPGWPVSTDGHILSSPAVANSVVYVYSYLDKLYAFNATTGALLWDSQDVITDFSYFSPAIGPNGAVYLATYADSKLYAFKATTGRKLWDSGTTMTGAIACEPAVANGRVYVATDDGLYAFDAATGALLPGWPVSTTALIESSPAVAKGVVYVGDNAGHVYAFNAVSGALLWRGEIGGGIWNSPAIADGTVYVSSADGYLYAFNLGAGLETRAAAGARKGVPRPDPAGLKPDYRLPLPE